MPDDVELWIIMALLFAVVVLFALSKKYNLHLKFGDKIFKFTQPEKSTANDDVQVLKEAKLEDVEIGDVTGVVDDSSHQESKKTVDVLGKAEIKKARIGDITGAKIGTSSDDKD